jgi:hypothetical protein
MIVSPTADNVTVASATLVPPFGVLVAEPAPVPTPGTKRASEVVQPAVATTAAARMAAIAATGPVRWATLAWWASIAQLARRANLARLAR